MHVWLPTPDLKWTNEGLGKERAGLAARTARTAPAERVLFAGGSGTVFSISAQEFEVQTGRFAHNVGAHAGLGMVGIAAIVRSVARPTDRVELAPEYAVLGAKDGLGTLTVPFLASEASLRLYSGGAEPQLRRILLLGSPGVSIVLSGVAEGLGLGRRGARPGRGECGDLLTFPESVARLPSVEVRLPSPAVLGVLRSLQTELAARGAHLMFALPFGYAEGSKLSLAQARVRQVAKALAEVAPVLSTDENMELSASDEDFSATAYHASFEGRSARTRRFARAFLERARESFQVERTHPPGLQ